MAISVANRAQGTRLPLTSLQTVYLGPGQIGPRDEDGYVSLDTTLRLLEGIRTTAIQEPGDILGYLNSLQKRFVLRGRIKRQIRALLRSSMPSIGKGTIYAAHPQATHRVLVYSFSGRPVNQKEGFFSSEYLEGAYGSFLGQLYEPDYITSPLARVDVRPPMKYLAGKYQAIEEYREAVACYAERIAIRWYQRFTSLIDTRWVANRNGKARTWRKVGGASWKRTPVTGISATMLCVLKPRDRRTLDKRVFSNERQTKSWNGSAPPSDKQRTSLSRLFDDLSGRR